MKPHHACMYSLIQRTENQSQSTFHLKTWDAEKPPLSLETCFLKDELALILHAF